MNRVQRNKSTNIPFEIELNDNVADKRFIADGMTEFERNVKRAGDFLLAIFGLIVFSPLFAVCYFLVKEKIMDLLSLNKKESADSANLSTYINSEV